jgi:hypothetical protein
MKSKTIYLFVLVSLFGYTQNTSSVKEEVSAKTSEESVKKLALQGMQAQFSPAAILAYQDQAAQKIVDFYSYLALYKQAEATQEFQGAIDESIQDLFLSDDLQVTNSLEATTTKNSLNTWLTNYKQQKTVLVFDKFIKKEVTSTYFLFMYAISLQSPTANKELFITQKVYFFPMIKTFGSTSKNVWNLKLGEF